MKWMSYPDLERIKQLRNEGRELLGKEISWQEKRDGENVSVWYDDDKEFHISSHHLEQASEDIVRRFEATPEAHKVKEWLLDERRTYNSHLILYGELLKTVSPTRLEPRRKHTHWILFDIYDVDENTFLPYTRVYQVAYQWRIPVVKEVFVTMSKTLEDLEARRLMALHWAKHHRREGVVAKAYYQEQVFSKEKLDIPERPKLERLQKTQIAYPPMDEHTIRRALEHAWDELLERAGPDTFDIRDTWKNKAIAMPVIAKHFNVEAQEHNFAMPKNIFGIYLQNLNFVRMTAIASEVAREVTS